jgi:hypothetical protein
MPGNIIKINDSDELSWYVGDSQMEKLLTLLDEVGFKDENSG